MKVAINKAFDFDAAHFLPKMPEGHKCRRLHGHTYCAEVRLFGEPGDDGILVDYGDIAKAWEPIHAALDHRCLNDIPGLEDPTTERLAPWILERFRRALPFVVSVRVYESSTTYCEAFTDDQGRLE